LVIDLAEVTLLASVGLRLRATANERFVLATAKRSVESGGFAVVAGGPETCRPIELTDLNEVFDLYLSLNDALEAMRPSIACGNHPVNAGEPSDANRIVPFLPDRKSASTVGT